MSTTQWRFLRFDDLDESKLMLKAHVAPAGLVRPLLNELASRGHNTKTEPQSITHAGMDQPGMVYVDRPWEGFRLPGLVLRLPSEDVTSFYQRIEQLEVRRFANGQEYFKLHSWMNCVVLRPTHKIALEVQLKKRMVSAEARALLFYADKKKASDVLREAAAKVRGVPLEQVPSLGERQANDRFFPRQRGEA